MMDIPRRASERRRQSMKRRLEINREKAQRAEHGAVVARREAVALLKQVAELEEEVGRLAEGWCTTCQKIVMLMYDFEEEGYVCFCPYCGAKIYFCVECYFKNSHGKGQEEAETITEFTDRFCPNRNCRYETKRGDARL